MGYTDPRFPIPYSDSTVMGSLPIAGTDYIRSVPDRGEEGAMERREFLKLSALAGAGLWLLPALRFGPTALGVGALSGRRAASSNVARTRSLEGHKTRGPRSPTSRP